MFATAKLSNPAAQSFLYQMGHPPAGALCYGQSAGMLNRSCYQMLAADLTKELTGSYNVCDPAVGTTPGSLGMSNTECDFRVELSDLSDGFIMPGNTKSALKFWYVTGTSTGQVRIVNTGGAVLDPDLRRIDQHPDLARAVSWWVPSRSPTESEESVNYGCQVDGDRPSAGPAATWQTVRLEQGPKGRGRTRTLYQDPPRHERRGPRRPRSGRRGPERRHSAPAQRAPPRRYLGIDGVPHRPEPRRRGDSPAPRGSAGPRLHLRHRWQHHGDEPLGLAGQRAHRQLPARRLRLRDAPAERGEVRRGVHAPGHAVPLRLRVLPPLAPHLRRRLHHRRAPADDDQPGLDRLGQQSLRLPQQRGAPASPRRATSQELLQPQRPEPGRPPR